jgi:outer membrane protein OmpU
MSKGITFAGSGDLDNGMTINYSYTMSDAAFSASSLKLDMGDMGVASFGSESSPHGINAYQDKMPSAGENVWDDMDGQANGIATIEDAGILGYGNSIGDVGVSISYQPGGTGMSESSKSGVVSFDGVEGVSLFLGMGDKAGASVNTGTDLMTMGGTYTSGAITAGIQLTDTDVSAVNGDNERLHAAVSFAVNENMSVSFGMSTIEFENTSKVDQELYRSTVSFSLPILSEDLESIESAVCAAWRVLVQAPQRLIPPVLVRAQICLCWASVAIYSANRGGEIQLHLVVWAWRKLAFAPSLRASRCKF